MNKKDFIKKIKIPAIKAYKKYNILPSLTIAQAICESGWGRSSLTSKYNNLFGIKWTPKCGYDYQLLWTSEWIKSEKRYVKVRAKFRKYDSWEESIEDHSKLLMLKRYTPVRECKDYLCATEQIRKCGYATSPTYTQTLRKIIEQNKLQVIDKLVKEEIEEITEEDIKQFIKLLEKTKEIILKLLEKFKKT